MSFYEESSIIITPNAYKAGTLYAVVPTSGAADMDVTRATAATRVDESGLVNYAEVLGGELAPPASDITQWDQSSSVTQSGTSFIISTGGYIFENIPLITSGTGKWVIEGSGDIKYRTNTADAYVTVTLPATVYPAFGTPNSRIQLSNSSGSDVTVDNISVKQVDRDNVPRIDYTGGGCPHILAEPQRTNLETTSASGSYGNSPASEILAIAPDGLNTAIRPVPDATSDRYQHTIIGGSYSSGDKVTYSWYRKRFSTPIDDTVVGDLVIQILVNVTVGATTEIASSINGYDRFSATFSITDGSLDSILRLYFGSLIGNGNSSVAYWGHQIEQGSYATSYIPTSGATVTRNQDQFTRDGISSLINSTEGCVFGEGNFAESNSSSYNYFVSLSDGTSSNRLEVRQSSPNLQFLWRVATYQSEISTSSLDVSSNFKFALNYSAANIKFYVNGDLIGTINTPTLWSVNTLNRLAFDDGAGGNRLSGKVKQLQVYPSALSDAELISLTTP
jgi:hypothetical protein